MHPVKCRIICIGNRYSSIDSAGIAVYEKLRDLNCLPPGVELIEGGTAGLNLLPHLELGGVIIFVDSVRGFTSPGSVILIQEDEIQNNLSTRSYDHGAGLEYLLTLLPRVYEKTLPEMILLVGIEGAWTEKIINQAANMTIDLAIQNLKGVE
jgi:hydrogenase maturation protease